VGPARGRLVWVADLRTHGDVAHGTGPTRFGVRVANPPGEVG